MVCYDCIGYGRICPACGTKTKRGVRRGALLGAMSGGTFLMMAFLFLALSFASDTDMWFIWPLIGIGAPFAVASVVLTFLSRKQTRMHEEHLSRMPKGTIPLEKRAGFGNLSAQRKWREENLARSMTGAGAMKDTYPDHIYEGLVGNWDFPVMTKEERVYMTAGIQRRVLVGTTVIIALGVFAILLGVFVLPYWEVIAFGVMFALLGSLGVFLVLYAKSMVKSDAEAEVKVMWKTVGFETAKEAIAGFLREQGLEAKLIKKKLPMWEHPEHKYVLPDGSNISFAYSEDRSGHVYRWLAIGYKPSGALAARKLQRELDEYLSERDLVRRVG
jgi:hypothetical protein